MHKIILICRCVPVQYGLHEFPPMVVSSIWLSRRVVGKRRGISRIDDFKNNNPSSSSRQFRSPSCRQPNLMLGRTSKKQKIWEL